MSKSLGTGMNPLAQIDAHGADATRYGLMKMASSQDVRFSEGAIEEGRKLANKLWNVARLILQAGEGAAPEERPQALEERWMLARLSQSQRAAERYLAEFDFSHLVDELYHLTFDDFCDWYREAIKQRLYDGDADARATATAALERLLKLLHPVMPHVTEEIWSYLPARATRLIVAPWPEAGDEARGRRTAADPGGGADVPPLGRAAAARGRREAHLRRGRQAGARAAAENGNVDAERARLRNEIERAERQLANERFVAERPRRRRRRGTRRSSSATGASSMQSATEWLAALSPWPRDGFGLEPDERAARAARRSGAPLRRGPRRRHEGKSTATRTIAALLARRRARERRVHLPARRAAGASGSTRTPTVSSGRSGACAPTPRRSARRSSRR